MSGEYGAMCLFSAYAEVFPVNLRRGAAEVALLRIRGGIS